jgi:hypothetical protein
MGTSLYRAFRPAGSRDPRVVRVRIADDPADERAAAWIRHEYDVLRALDDPRVPTAHGYYASQVAVAIGDADAITLREALDVRAEGRVPIDVATALDLLVELVEALRHAHGSTVIDGGVVHAALRPGLIELDRSGRVHVYGFGADPGPPARGYAAPELEAAAFVDPRTDQWALGALAIELVLGQRVYDDAPDADAAAAAGRVGVWVDRLERRFPALARVVGRLLAPAAGDRYADEGELLRELLEISRTVGGRADRAALVGRVLAARPEPEPEPEPEPPPEPEPEPEPTPEPEPEPEPAEEEELEPTVVAPPAPVDRGRLPTSSTLVPDPADAPSVDAPAPADPTAVPDPSAEPPAAPAVASAEVTVEDDSLSFTGGTPELAVTSDDVEVTDPMVAAPRPVVPEEEEVTEIAPPPAPTDGPSLGPITPVSDDEPPPVAPDATPRWSPMEMVALGLAGLLVVVGLVFMVWRFG